MINREKLFTKIITQVSSGHEDEYADLAKEIDQREEIELCEDYKSKLSDLKDNPVEEKELAAIIEKASNAEISQFEIAAYILGKDFAKAEDMDQVALLIARATKKVLSYEDDRGIVKKTKNFEEYEPMKPIDRMAYETLTIGISELKDEALDEKNKEVESFIEEKTKIKFENLIPWERSLLQAILEKEAKSISNIFLGKK